jgi:hypothetical protein
MANGHGGRREGAGRPPGISNPNAGRPPGTTDVTLSPARIVSPGQKWRYAEKALVYAEAMLERMVQLARTAESEAVRLAAQDKILDRALGKAPQQHVDITALRHTEIVYRSAQEIRQELIARGVPHVLLDYDKNSDKP